MVKERRAKHAREGVEELESGGGDQVVGPVRECRRRRGRGRRTSLQSSLSLVKCAGEEKKATYHLR